MQKRTAFVTGASRGIGRAIALELARQGTSVAVGYRSNEEQAQQVVSSIELANGRATAVQMDLANPAEILSAWRSMVSRFGPIDILVNNAARLYVADLDDYEPANMEAMRRVNVDGLIQVTRAAIPSMRERKFGRIVNISSIAALGTSVSGNTFYAATKAAVVLLTRRFAMELGSSGITVNAVAPGYIETDMAAQGRTQEELESLSRRVAANSMVGRTGQPQDVAGAVAFLASDAASFITAQVLTVDGGRMDYIGHA